MAEPTNEEAMLLTQMSQIFGSQDTNILKMTAVADAQKEHEQGKNGNDLKQQGGEKTTRNISSRRFQRYKAPKFLSLLQAMDMQVNNEDEAWLASRTEAQLDMLMSIKKMAMERAKTIQDKRVNEIFNFKILRTIGVLLEEFVRESLKNTLSSGDTVETPMVQSEKDEQRIPLEKDRECNHIKPIVKVELEEMTATDVTPMIPSEKDEERIPLEKARECNHIKPIVKVELEEMAATDATPVIPSEKDEERIPLEKAREFNQMKPIVKVELEEMAATDATPVIPSEKDEERIPLEKVREFNQMKPIVKVESEEMTATDVMKRKRNSSCEEDVHLKKRKKKRKYISPWI